MGRILELYSFQKNKMDKKEIRKIYLKKRNLLNEKDINELSFRISENIFETEIYKTSKSIFTYINMGSEVITTSIINRALKDNKIVAVPVMTSAKHEMVFIKINSLNNLKKNDFGILEPEIENENIIKSDKNTLILVPGLAFSKTKYRIGYGGGYYDKYLNENVSLENMGICYNFQIIESVSYSCFDKKVDIIVTDERILY